MTQPENSDNPDFEIVMPFIEVVSNGGEYEDVAFAAGFQCGQIDGKLESRKIVVIVFTIFTKLIDQVDLIAMRHGYKIEVFYKDDVWAQLCITRIDEEVST